MEKNSFPLDQWNKEFEDAEAREIVSFMIREFGNKIAFASSMGVEDQVLTEIISSIDPNIRIFTLDTGRLFQETYDLIQTTNARFNINIEVYFPQQDEVEQMVREKGVNLFYDSIENRKRCCQVRKVEPLKRAMKGLSAWISGLRREQGVTRQAIRIVDWDQNYALLKINPLASWSDQQLWQYIENNNIPVNPLHKKGYPSIGCQPCTREVLPGEDIRAGRWWWENPDTRECGLHKREGLTPPTH